jgi:hypothetical protein
LIVRPGDCHARIDRFRKFLEFSRLPDFRTKVLIDIAFHHSRVWTLSDENVHFRF